MAKHDSNIGGQHMSHSTPHSGSGEADRSPSGTGAQVSHEFGRALGETTREVTDRARQMKDQIAGQVKEVAGEATQQAKSMLDERKAMASDALGGVAQALRHTAGQMGDRRMMAQYAERAADRIDTLSRHIAEKDLGQIIREAEDLGRRRPEALIGGALAAGFLFARFVKASRRSAGSPARTAGTTAPTTHQSSWPSSVGASSE